MHSKDEVSHAVGGRPRDGFAKIVAMTSGVGFTFFGAWALLAPKAFFDALAKFDPYNEHFVHDIGAFQLGIGASLLAGVLLRDALFATLAGGAVGATAHAISHIIDRDLGGNAARDVAIFSLMALALVTAAVRTGRDQTSHDHAAPSSHHPLDEAPSA